MSRPRLSLTELENNTNDLHNKFEITFAHQEEQLQQKEKELQSLQAAFDDLSDKVYQLEDENDRLREDAERQHEEDAVDRERLEAVCAGLKEVRCFECIVDALLIVTRKSPISKTNSKT